jgi:hypothetical protein
MSRSRKKKLGTPCADGIAVGTGGSQGFGANEQEKDAGNFSREKIEPTCADGIAVGIATAVR